MRGELKGAKDYREINKKTRKYMEMAKETQIEGQSKKWKHASDSIIARKLTNKSNTLPQRNWVNLQPYTTSKESTSLRSLKYLTDGQSTAQTYTIMRPLPILREEVEAADKAPKSGKSTGDDNIPAELFKAGDAMIDVLIAVCHKISKTGEWPTDWTKPLIISLP